MTDIQSKEVIDKISDELKIQPALVIPRVISKDIQLTYGVNPVRVSDNIDAMSDVAEKTTTGALIILTTSSDKDYFLTSLNVSFVKDAVCDSATGAYSVTVIINGRSTFLVSLPIITLTAERADIFLAFPSPIKLDRGSNIVITGTFTVGVCVRTANCQGFVTNPQ